jgi:predicted ATPase
LDTGIFVVVNLLNAGFGGDCDNNASKSRKLSKRHLMLAELNLKAARKVSKLSTFESAQKYTVMGIQMLPSDRWMKHYDILSIELYSTAAETEGYLGLVDEMKLLHCNEVLDQKRGNVRDKLRVHNILMDSLYIREDLQAATKHCL